MIPTNNGQPLYAGHLKGNEELYIKDDSLVVIHEKKGNVFSINLDHIRCAYPISHDLVRIFWRAPKNRGSVWKYWSRYHQDFKLDLKKSFPDKKQRRVAERTESKRLANVLLHAIQKNYSINQPNMKGYLAMHMGEYLMGSYEAQCKYGKGDMLITNLGIYFVTNEGLCLDMPLDILDSYDHKDKTVKIHFFEPMWKDGYDVSTKKNRNIEIRIKNESAQTVNDMITKAYADGGAKEVRTLTKLTDEFGSMTSGEIYTEYHSGKHGTFKPIDDYLQILAKRRWGMPPTQEIREMDGHVVRACLCAGISIDAAGDLTDKDKKFREDILSYHTRYEESSKQYLPLITDIMDIITKNLTEDDANKVKTYCNPYIVFDTLKELAENGSIPESFNPPSAIEWQQFKKDTNGKVINQRLSDFPNGFNFTWIDDVFCPWSVDDAKKITSNKDYKSILGAITSLNEKSNVNKYLDGFMYAKTFQTTQQYEISLRARRVYDEWCKTHPLSEWTDPTDRRWVQYVLDNLNEEQAELRRDHHGLDKTVSDILREKEMESQNKKTRLERTMKPKNIPDKDIYTDTWYDSTKHRWFTTNPYFRISETNLAIMNPDECDQKHGYRATVFSEDAVELKHGYPAVYNEEKKWWVLLCTISDDKITKEMETDKRIHGTLRYEAVEPNLTLGNTGSFAYATEQEFFFDVQEDHDYDVKYLLPFNERIRRFLFTEITACGVCINEKDKIQQTPLITA